MEANLIIDKQWYTGKGEKVENILNRLKDELRHNDQTIRVGTDAQRIGQGVDFVTVVVIYKERKGGKMFYTRTRAARSGMSLWEKLSLETWYSLEIAMEIEKFASFGAEQIEVHADANPNPKWKSSDYHKQIAGMIMGQGFAAVLKPNAWVSSHAADHIVKLKHVSRSKARTYKRSMKKMRVAAGQ